MLNDERFNKNLSKYDRNAILQKNIAKELIRLLKLNVGENFRNIFEIGCGSGFLTREIVQNLKYKILILNDIVENSENYVRNFGNNFVKGDAEKIIFPLNSDLVISSSVFQWFNDFKSFVSKVYNSLNNNGILAFSMFTDGNFKEIKDFFNISLHYLQEDEIKKIILQKNFEILFSNSIRTILNFDSSIDILKHIKDTGINVIRKQKLEKNKIYSFIRSNILNLTYNYYFIIARKK